MRFFEELLMQLEANSSDKLRKTIVNLAMQFDDFLLLHESVSEEAMEFLLTVLNNERVLQAQGIERFLLDINVDLYKYTDGQLAKILSVLVKNVDRVGDGLSRHSIGDFIGRAYPLGLAYETLVQLAAGSKRQKHVAFVGIDVMSRRNLHDAAMQSMVEQKREEMLAHDDTGSA